MKISKQQIQDRLLTTSVHDLAVELTEQMAEAYKGRHIVDREATIAKFEKQLAPLAPKTVKATDLMRSHGVEVTAL